MHFRIRPDVHIPKWSGNIHLKNNPKIKLSTTAFLNSLIPRSSPLFSWEFPSPTAPETFPFFRHFSLAIHVDGRKPKQGNVASWDFELLNATDILFNSFLHQQQQQQQRENKLRLRRFSLLIAIDPFYASARRDPFWHNPLFNSRKIVYFFFPLSIF